jgi:hypothetical protein
MKQDDTGPNSVHIQTLVIHQLPPSCYDVKCVR